MRVLFVIDQMIGGGAAKKMTIIANELYHRGYSIFIATNIYKPIVYRLDDGVQLLSIYEKDAYKYSRFFRFFKTARLLRGAFNSISPDVVVSFLPHVAFLTKVSLIGKHTKIVFSDETSFARKDNTVLKYLRHHFYKYGDALVVLTENDCSLLGKRFSRKIAIHNPVEQKSVSLKPIAERTKRVVVIGQTSRWYIKGLDIAVEIWSDIAKDFPEWRLSIVGAKDSQSEEYLIGIADESVRRQIEFLGFQEDILGILADAQVFLLSSRIEGFSLSLVEAMMAGTPSLAFSEYGVVEEVSLGGKGTVIVSDNNKESMAEALRVLLGNTQMLEKLSDEGPDVAKHYAPESIVNQWEGLFRSLINI